MKSKIINSLKKIQKLAEQTNIEGQLTIEFKGCTINNWDKAIESIAEFQRYKHHIQVTPKLTVTLLLG
jgi:hypothetical protein